MSWRAGRIGLTLRRGRPFVRDCLRDSYLSPNKQPNEKNSNKGKIGNSRSSCQETEFVWTDGRLASVVWFLHDREERKRCLGGTRRIAGGRGACETATWIDIPKRGGGEEVEVSTLREIKYWKGRGCFSMDDRLSTWTAGVSLERDWRCCRW